MSEKSERQITDNSSIFEHLAPVSLLLLLAAALRLVSLSREPMLNPDGIAYILQAKAFYLHQAEQFLNVYPYPTNLSLMIAGIYGFIGDWVVSGQIVSIFFSLLTIIPFYFLNRIFWNRQTAFTIVILYVASPLFIELSHEIIRGPQFWFFLSLGLWAFCYFMEKENRPGYLLIISSTAFIMTAWSRIEGLLPLLLGAGWLIFDYRFRKPRYLVAYFLPILLIFLFSGLLSLNIDLPKALLHGFVGRLDAAINRFQWLRNALLNLELSPPLGVVPDFFDKARDLIWFLALGVTSHCLIKTFGIIFFPLTIFGIVKIPNFKPIFNSKKRPLLFLILLLLSGLTVIYIQILLNWSSSERFVALIYFPGLIFAGYGFNKLFAFWHQLKPDSHPASYLWLCLLLLLFALPSVVDSGNRIRSLVFKELGLHLAEIPATTHGLHLCGTSKKILYTHFYAQLEKPELSSPWEQCDIIKVSDLTPDFLVNTSYDYLILSDRDGGRQRLLEIMAERKEANFSVLFEKRCDKYGKIYLFGQLKSGNPRKILKTGDKD